MRFFHYTDSLGLLGILEHKCIWASEIGFLSDTSEYITAIQKCRDIIGKYLAKDTTAEGEMAKRLVDFLLNWQENDVNGIFVASFSEEGNLLNQWRSYCPIGGFAIGFNSNYMKNYLGLTQCLYKASDHERVIKAQFVSPFIKNSESWFRKNLHRFVLDGSNDSVFKEPEFLEIINSIQLIAPLIKNTVFHEEKEWRIVESQNLENRCVEYRASKYFPIPYIKKSIDINMIEMIVIGPTPERRIAINSLRALLKKHNISCKIVYDTLPYRSW